MVFTCSQCEFSSPRQDVVKRHHSSFYGSPVQYQCNRCPYSTSRSNNFYHHLKLCRRPREASIPPPPSKKARQVEPEPSKLRPSVIVTNSSIPPQPSRCSVIQPTPNPVAGPSNPNYPWQVRKVLMLYWGNTVPILRNTSELHLMQKVASKHKSTWNVNSNKPI